MSGEPGESQLPMGLVGAGNMGEALLRALTGQRLRLIVAETSAAKRTALSRQYGSRIELVTTAAQAATEAPVVILAVKPQDAPKALQEIRKAWEAQPKGHRLIISIAAGLSTAYIEGQVPGKTAVVRVMPNLAAKVGKAISAIVGGKWAVDADLRIAKRCFTTVGEVVEAPESAMDAVTAVSGSGPAYFFLLAAALAEAGVKVGLTKAIAEQLARQTAIGAAALLARTAEPAATLVKQVASKGGTTEAALKVLTKKQWQAIFIEAVKAAHKRAKELSWQP
ncbi:MAG: pyrroline-5-carboxylate reductase [Candidatus Omnitrophica bacterium]|nr:pyrroline-5-carboxylate reductase [Candidatus Omnitrophota bacterium]